MSRHDRERRLLLLREIKIRKAQSCFWEFCRTLAPKFYKDSRPHLKELCDILQKFYEGKITRADGFVYKRLMINMPPRHGKSRTLILFCMWIFGLLASNRIITFSYNETLATDFSRYTRDGIQQVKNQPQEIVYSDIFPYSKIKQGDSGYKSWALEGQYFNYKGVGLGSGVTGKGCNILIGDDPVKDAETAFNEEALDKIWRDYTGTFLSRKEEGAIEIICATRWSKKDPSGRILISEDANEWYVLHMEAQDNKGQMLCPELLSKSSYNTLKSQMDNIIFLANYHQRPIDIKGVLYKDIKTYRPDDMPVSFEMIGAYADTADEGDCYLCLIVFGIYGGEVYILDVYYTKEGMEITEPESARVLVENKVNNALIESNNGGKGFARAVEKVIWEKYKTRSVCVSWFHQSSNKIGRILANSYYIMKHFYFPYNWKNRWSMFYESINTFQKDGKNKYLDGPDALTGVAEMVNEGQDEIIEVGEYELG